MRFIQPVQRNHGFSLVELMVVLIVLAIVVSIALPSFTDMIRRTHIDAAGDELVGALRLARSEALQRNLSVQLVPSTSGGNYKDGWRVEENKDGTLKTLRMFNEGFDDAVSCSSCTATVVFTGAGSATSAASFKLQDGNLTSCIRVTLGGGISHEDCP